MECSPIKVWDVLKDWAELKNPIIEFVKGKAEVKLNATASWVQTICYTVKSVLPALALKRNCFVLLAGYAVTSLG